MTWCSCSCPRWEPSSRPTIPLSEVESTKSVSDVYAPVRGTVLEVNTDLTDAPGRLNDDPYGEGWICVIEPDDLGSYDGLLDAAAYRALIAE